MIGQWYVYMAFAFLWAFNGGWSFSSAGYARPFHRGKSRRQWRKECVLSLLAAGIFTALAIWAHQ